ncbi:unnamed protein product [Mytilus coruscus]|uniref:B box-type domain-containing protein n=1 Tax=Mytilus coruscus TaxID=42192 RepID=A0A6J8DNG1_MYTCO|nr:unnamed protein product [Mytilus coruscus]
MAQVSSFNCEICASGPGYYYCNQCDLMFCDGCKLSHLRTKITKNHKFLSYPNINPEGKQYCKEHYENCIFYCIECNTSICKRCAITKHSSHDLVENNLARMNQRFIFKEEFHIRCLKDEREAISHKPGIENRFEKPKFDARKDVLKVTHTVQFKRDKYSQLKTDESDEIGSKNQIQNCIGIICNGMYVECIIDKRLLTSMRYAKPNQVEWQHGEMKGVSEKIDKIKVGNKGSKTKKTVNSEFQLMVDVDVDNTVEHFKDAVRKGFGLCCRLILFKEGHQLSNENLHAGLSECIQHVNTNKNEDQQIKYLDTAKAISLEFTRRFFLKCNGKFKLKHVYLAFKCKCREKQNKINFCSNELFIIVEADDPISDLDDYFAGFCIKQQYNSRNSQSENTSLKHAESLYLTEKQESVSLEHGMSAEIAENYFNKHSNILAIVPAFLRSVNFESEINHSVRLEKCITFYCKYKGFIPIGEVHFPSEVLSIDGNIVKIDVTNGNFNLAMQRVGDSVESVQMRGTIGGFLKYYNKDCFMTCAHVVMGADSMISKKNHPLHRKDLSMFVRDQQGQLIKCGNAIRCIFEPGSSNQPGLDVAVIEFEGRQMMNVRDFVIDSYGNSRTCKYLDRDNKRIKTRKERMENSQDEVNKTVNVNIDFSEVVIDSGLSDGYLNDNYIDYELLTINRATQDIHAYGSTTRGGKHTVMFRNEEDIEIELQGLGQAAAVANGNVIFPIMIASQAHFQQVQTCLSSPKTFRMYNQLYLNIPLIQGDSGTGIYIQNYIQNGCLGMAIAFLNGNSVVTPMKTIFSKID